MRNEKELAVSVMQMCIINKAEFAVVFDELFMVKYNNNVPSRPTIGITYENSWVGYDYTLA